MKVNFNVPFKDYKGKETEEVISDKVAEALYISGSKGDQVSNDNKYKAYKLCRRVGEAEGEVEISADEAVLIKEICANYLVAGGYGQIVELIEGGE